MDEFRRHYLPRTGKCFNSCPGRYRPDGCRGGSRLFTSMSKRFSHLDKHGSARMVNVGHKPLQRRRATAAGKLLCAPATIRALKKNALPKGDVLTVAQIAGVQAAKKTSELIPLCHPLALNHVEIHFKVRRESIDVVC